MLNKNRCPQIRNLCSGVWWNRWRNEGLGSCDCVYVRLGRGGFSAPAAAFKLFSAGTCPGGARGETERFLPLRRLSRGSCATGPSALSSWLLYLSHLLEKLGTAVETFGLTSCFWHFQLWCDFHVKKPRGRGSRQELLHFVRLSLFLGTRGAHSGTRLRLAAGGAAAEKGAFVPMFLYHSLAEEKRVLGIRCSRGNTLLSSLSE